MKKKFTFLLLIVSTFYVQAQKPVATYNHIQFYVHNVDTSVAFYTKVFAADTILCPFPPTETRRTKWLKVANNTELHLSQNIPDTILFNNQFHLGFNVVSIDGFIKQLMKESSDYRVGKYKEPTIDRMPSGAKTTMIRDPDGNRIHLIEAH
jgi:catechol 2,3-dioxygenase-like lactoylglutathione lyase family enzyme